MFACHMQFNKSRSASTHVYGIWLNTPPNFMEPCPQGSNQETTPGAVWWIPMSPP